jgi:anaerobic selenocysteine-containing dehydrogenase
LLLISRRQHEVYNSVGHNLPALARKVAYNPIYMNPEDAASLQVDDGDRVELSTHRCSVPGIVKLAPDVRRGVVSVAHGFPNFPAGKQSGGHPGTAVSALIDDEIDYDPISGLPVMSAVPVSVSVPGSKAHAP